MMNTIKTTEKHRVSSCKTPFRYLTSFLAIILYLSVTNNLNATTLRSLALGDLVIESTYIALGTATAIETTRQPSGRIIRLVTFDVEQHLGSPGPKQLTILLLGGTIGRETQHVSGANTLRLGQTALLFLEQPTTQRNGELLITGMIQGHFRVITDDRTNQRFATRDVPFEGILFSNPAADSLIKGQAGTSTFIPLDRLIEEIKRLDRGE